MRAVSNASPIISLSAVGRFDFLTSIFEELVVPHAVFDEVVERGLGRPGEDQLREAVNTGRFRVAAPADRPAVEVLRDRLAQGESEAIVLARELGADFLLIDEHRARRVALAMGLTVMGSLGVLKIGNDQGLLEQPLGTVLDQLIQFGFRISERVRQDFLA